MITGSKLWGRVRTEIRDAKTGRVKRKSGWRDNLVFDSCLNALANGSSGFAQLFQAVKIGSGTNPNSVASGAVTFTQVGTAITASTVGWFTANNVVANSLIKYGSGSGGAEQYVVSIDGTGTIATVAGAGMTVATPTVGTVWFVQQTALQNFLYASATYDTSGGSNTTAFSTNQATMQRTVVFPVQVSPYIVNEIGYYDSTGGGGAVNGRIGDGAFSDVVAPTEFYVVVIQMTYLVSPPTITAVGNVGTNFNTAGTAAWQYWAVSLVQPDGSTNTNLGVMDNSVANPYFNFHNADDITQNASPAAGLPPDFGPNSYSISVPHGSNAGQPVGVGVATQAYSFTTAGETCYSIFFSQNSGSVARILFCILLTTPQILPTGTMAGNVSFQWTFTRTLTN